MIFKSAQPNPAHLALAAWEAAGKISAIVTQNIDGLHQAAGSKNVIELHGSVHRNLCMRCKKAYVLHDILNSAGVPKCPCGGIIKPDVVLYEEPLDQTVMENAVREIAGADMLLIGGTSLSVYPAAGFIQAFCGKYIAIINKTPTSMDLKADVAIAEPIGITLEKIHA
jgi:NAD-dependent deacetylase